MSQIKSPCILICSIEQKSGHCFGCGRTSQEIASWVGMTDEERARLMTDELPLRVSKLERRPRRITKRSKLRNTKGQSQGERDIIDLKS